MSTGEVLVARAAMKPLATLNRPDAARRSTPPPRRRRCRSRSAPTSPPCPAMGVVAETMVGARAGRRGHRKFGGDSVAELVRNADAFRASLALTPAVARARRCSSGMMGSGKTPSVAGSRRGSTGHFVDTDAVIEERAGRTIARDLRAGRRAAFRVLESRACSEELLDPRTRRHRRGGRRRAPAPENRARCSAGRRPYGSARTPAPRCSRVGSATRTIVRCIGDDPLGTPPPAPRRARAALPRGGRRRRRRGRAPPSRRSPNRSWRPRRPGDGE